MGRLYNFTVTATARMDTTKYKMHSGNILLFSYGPCVSIAKEKYILLQVKAVKMDPMIPAKGPYRVLSLKLL